jgi:hypothetical protein
MRATVLQSTSLSELDALGSAYSLPSNFPKLSNFERSAILRGIEAELTDRIATWKYGFRFVSEIERLQAALEAKEDQIFHLELKVTMLEAELEVEEAKNGEAKPQA